MKRYALIIFLFLPILFSGCLRTYYPINHSLAQSPIIFETDTTSNYLSKYISADITVADGNYENERVTIMRGSFSTASTTDYTNTNLELFSYYGNYKVVGISNNSDGSKNGFGIGGTFKFALNFKIEDVKFGAGINLGLENEFGEYIDFIKRASIDGLIEDNSNQLNAIVSIFPFVAIRLSPSTILSAQINVGIPEVASPIIMLSSSDISIWTSYISENQYNENNYEFSKSRFVFGMKYRL